MGQGVLNGIADLKVGPETQHPMNFGATLLDNIPQEGGGSSVGLVVISPERSSTANANAPSTHAPAERFG